MNGEFDAAAGQSGVARAKTVTQPSPTRDRSIATRAATDGLQSIVELAKTLFDAQASVIGLASHGDLDPLHLSGVLAEDLAEASDFYRDTLQGSRSAIVPDTRDHPMFAASARGRGCRFHAAAPLTARDGRAFGILAVMDAAPRPESVVTRQADLMRLAQLAARLIEQNAELTRSKRDFEAIFQKIPKPLWIYDPATLAFLDVNEATVSFYGYSREAFMAMTVLDIRPDHEQTRMIAAIRERSDLGSASLWRHRKADGTEFDVVTNGKGIHFHGVDAILVIALDRTEVQSLRKTLGETQLLLDTIIEAMPLGVFVKDMEDEGRYVIYNSAVGEIVGRDCAAVIGRKDRQIFGVLESAKFASQDYAVMANGRQLVVAEESVTRPDGESLLIRTVKKPLPTTDGSKPRYLLGISEDVTARRQSEDRLAHMASHDSLTELPNRLQFKDHLDRALARRKGTGAVTVTYIDLDFFKTINDTYGHHVGDALLKKVAARLKSSLRRSDLVARLGGDEFAIVTRVEGGEEEALKVADRVLETFNKPFDLGECIAHIDASIGIAIASQIPESGEALMRYADIALYAAKAEGRGLAKVHAGSMSNYVETRQMMSEDLRRAIAQEQFEIDYQPLYDLATEQVTGFEALIRWRHPVRGLISPAEFIPFAEQTGLIVPIGDWVLRQACREAAGWPRGIKVAVNLSAVQFKKPGLVASITGILGETGLAPQRLELEVTESILLVDSGANAQTLHTLRALGIRIAMDDFGTGYSSLSYLRSFPFDKIKMDRSFVSDVCENPGSLAIVRAVTGLGSSLSITTTAEGIESQEQFDKLRLEGFDELQGFLIGRPMSAIKARTLANAQGQSEILALAG